MERRLPRCVSVTHLIGSSHRLAAHAHDNEVGPLHLALALVNAQQSEIAKVLPAGKRLDDLEKEMRQAQKLTRIPYAGMSRPLSKGAEAILRKADELALRMGESKLTATTILRALLDSTDEETEQLSRLLKEYNITWENLQPQVNTRKRPS